MRRWLPIAIVAVVLATATGPSVAGDPQKIASDGTVHRIHVEARSPESGRVGTVLNHVMQLPDGVITVRTVPGTDDDAVESAPAIDVDPNDNSLLLVWIRNDGGRSELLMSRFRAGTWGPSVAVAGAGFDASSPRLAVTRNWIHLIWTEPWGGTRAPWRGVFRHDDLGLAFGPEALPRNLDAPSVGTGGTSGPDWTQVYLSLYLPAWFPGGNGTVHVWGIRDEPVPIGYHQGHLLPPGMSKVQDLEADWTGGALTYWFHDDLRFAYRTNRKGTWGPFRFVALDDQTDVDAARLQMVEMLRRR